MAVDEVIDFQYSLAIALDFVPLERFHDCLFPILDAIYHLVFDVVDEQCSQIVRHRQNALKRFLVREKLVK